MTFSLEIETADEVAAQVQEARAGAIRAECRRRILAVMDETAQMNLAADAAAGRFDEAGGRAYGAALVWRDAMRARAREFRQGRPGDFTSDAAWPAPAPAIADLAAGS